MFEGKWIEVKDGIGWEAECYTSGHGTVYQHTQTNYKQLPVVITNFRCPNCDSTIFEPIYRGDNPINFKLADVMYGPGSNAGQPRTDDKIIEEYRCPGCTVRFDDPTKFSKNQPVDVVPPEPTPTPLEQLWMDKAQKKIELSGGRDCHSDHRTRNAFLESSEYNNVCELCGATDTVNKGWGKLSDPCPASRQKRQSYDRKKKATATKG